MSKLNFMKHFLVVVLLVISNIGSTQDKTSSGTTNFNLDDEIPKDTTAIRGVLPNGLKYFIKENSKPKNTAYIRLIVKAGNLNEDKAQLGLAHLLEHMGFNGTKSFKKDKLKTYIERVGMRFGSDLNASTSNYETVYKLKIPTENEKVIDKSFQILEDWAHNMSLEEDAINEERPVVVEEFRRKLGSGNRIRKQIHEFSYQGLPHLNYYSEDKLEHLKHFETSHIRRFYKEWYRPNLMGIVVVGSINPQAIERRIKKHFLQLENPINEKQFVLQDSIPYHLETKVKVIADPEKTQTYLSLSFVDRSPRRKEPVLIKHHRDNLVRGMMISMLNKRLRVVSNGVNAPFIGANVRLRSTLSRAQQEFVIGASLKEEEIEVALSHMVIELERVKRFGFTSEELKRAKKNRLAYNTAFLEGMEDWSSRRYTNLLSSEFYNSWVLYNKDWKYNFEKHLVPSLTLEDMNAMFKTYYHKDNRVMILTAPEKENLKLPSQDVLLETLKEAETKTDISKYTPAVIDGDLIKTLRPRGHIVKEEKELHGIKRLTLSNGATVSYKQTSFDKEKVSFKGVSHGGSSLLSDTEATTIGPLLSLMRSTGIGDYKTYELTELLTGKIVKLSSRISTYDESFKGHARTKDLETLFQLIYLNFTSINKDETTYRSVVNKIKASAKNRKLKPSTLFFEAINKIRQKGNPRYINTNENNNLERLLDSVPYASIYNTYTERFANGGDFDFIFVGDFNEALLKQYTEMYLAALPSTEDPREVSKTIPFKNELKDANVTVYKGLEDKATLRMYFEAEAEFKKNENTAMNIFGAIFKQRLRSSIREEKGAVYAVRTSLKHIKRPYPKYSALVTFDCDPKNIDALEQETLNVLRAFIKSGPTKKEVDAIKKNWILNREKRVEKNSFWLNYIYNKAYWKRAYKPFGDYALELEAITPRYIRSVAKKYIKTPSLTAKLLPESSKAIGGN